MILSGKCEDSTCSTISDDVTPLKSCMDDPSSTACSGLTTMSYFHSNKGINIFIQDKYGAVTNLPGVIAGIIGTFSDLWLVGYF